MLKTEAEGLGFQQLPRDQANVNAWKNMFDPYINKEWTLPAQLGQLETEQDGKGMLRNHL